MAFDISKKITFVLNATGGAQVEGEAKRAAGGLMSIESAGQRMHGVLAGLVGAISVGAFAGWIKGAIDAADATSKFSAKTGVAVADVAGLQLAFQQGGVGADALTGGIAKLSKQMVAGNDAFDTLGVKTRNADGTMRNVKEVLYDTADAFEGITDGAVKSALAQELFGKSGADMIPVLNGGADGMREMADMAERLGLVISEDAATAAEQFNDTTELLGLGLQGVARQVMAQIVPALASVAGGFLTAMTEGDNLRTVSDALGTGLKLLYTVFAGGIQIIGSFGKVLGGVGAAIVALVSGDFGAVKTIGAELMNDIKTDWTKTIANIGTVWDGSAGKSVTAMTKVVKAQRDVTVSTKEVGEAQKKVVDEYAKAIKAGDDLVASLGEKGKAIQLELDMGRKLTDAEKELLALEDKLRSGKIALTDAGLANARATIAQNAALADNLRWITQTTRENNAARDAIDKSTQELDKQIQAQRETNAQIGLSSAALAEHEAALLDDKAAAIDLRAAMLELVDPSVAESLRAEADGWRELAGLKRENFDRKAAVETQDAWMKTIQGLGAGFFDSLAGGARSAKDYVVEQFRNLVIKVPLQMIGGAFSGAIGSLFSGGAAAGPADALAGLGGGGGGGLLSGLGSISSGLGALGSFGATGLMSTLTGTGLGTSLGAAGSLMSGGSIMGGLGMGLGAIAPYALAIAALASLDKKKTPHVGGYAMAGADGSVADITAAQGGRQVAESQSAVEALAATAAGLLNDAAKGFGSQGGYSVRSVFESDNNDPSWGLFHMLQQGQKTGGSRDMLGTLASDPKAGFAEYAGQAAAAVRDEILGMDLPKWAADTLTALGATPQLENLAQAVGTINATRDALAGMVAAVEPFGGVFGRLGSLSSDAQMQLAGFTGGIEQFVQKTTAYVSSYYTEQEQMALKAQGILEQLSAVGLDAGAATEKGQLRTAMDSLDPASEMGRQQMAALLNVASTYAEVSTYLQANKLSLGDLASGSPTSAVLDAVKAPAEQTAEATRTVATNTADTAAKVAEVVTAQQTQTAVLAEGMRALQATMAEVAGRLGSIESSMQLAATEPA